MDLPAARIQGPSRSRAARAAVIVASACVLFAAVAVVLKRGASGQVTCEDGVAWRELGMGGSGGCFVGGCRVVHAAGFGEIGKLLVAGG